MEQLRYGCLAGGDHSLTHQLSELHLVDAQLVTHHGR